MTTYAALKKLTLLHTQYPVEDTPAHPIFKRTKISSLEIDIFWLKNDGEKWSRMF